MKIQTTEKISIQEVNDLREIIKTIAPSGQVLKEKLEILIEFNAYILQIDNSIKLNEYCINIVNTSLNISATDISRLKKHIAHINFSQNRKDKFLINNDGKFTIDRKLSLLDVHKAYVHLFDKQALEELDEGRIKFEDVEYYSSIKIYDFYKSTKEKSALFGNEDIQNALWQLDRHKKIKKLEIVSIIDNNDIHQMFKYLYDNYKDKVAIKYIADTESSYIPSVFFVLLKFKVKNSNNYREYIFYLEEEVNFGVAGFALQKNSLKQFYDLLETRFDLQFQNPNNIDFSVKDKKDIFEVSLNNIISEMKIILEKQPDEIEKDIQNLRTKIISMKLHYPKMNYAFQLLEKLSNYIVSISKISKEIKNGGDLNNTAYLIKEIIDHEINPTIDQVLRQAQIDQILIKRKINIKLLRASIFVNTVAYSDKAICDIYEQLNWTTTNDILLSLQAIENSESLLQELFSYFNITKESMSFKDMQSLFRDTIMEQIIKGESLSLGFQNKLFFL